MDEFEIMRQQLASMKLQLDTQQIINHDLMRKVMRGKASWINLFVKAELIAMPFLCLFIVWLCYYNGISQWFSFAFLLLGGIDAILDIRTVRIPPSLFSSSSMLGLKKFLVRQKKERFIQTCVSSTLSIVWFLLLVYALFTSGRFILPGDEFHEAAQLGGLIVGIIGALVAIIIIVAIYRKLQCANDQILSDIDRLENEK